MALNILNFNLLLILAPETTKTTIVKTLPFMKNALLALISTLFLLFNFNLAKASHLLGADVSWSCKGDSSFTITITGYRDCNGYAISGEDISLVPTGAGKCSSGTITLSGNMTNGIDITPVCKTSCDRCTNSSCTFAFGELQSEETVTENFPSGSCCKYEIQWSECCRSNSLTTINPDNLYINVVLDRCDTPCDASPYFSMPPVSIICTGQCYMLNEGVVDTNLDASGNPDSLVYKLIAPLNSGGSPLSWNSPYNYKEPLKYNGAFGNPNGKWDPAHKICDGFHLDSFNGDLFFEPVKSDVTVIGIQVQAWKKNAIGQPYLASWIRRDVQLIIMQCPANHLPTLTGVNGANIYSVNYCVGDYKCFNIISYDQDDSDSVMVSWNGALATLGATFIVDNDSIKHPVGKFCWKPTIARSYPYYFVVRAQDNACPVNGRTSQAYAITVHPPMAKTKFKDSVASCGMVTFTVDSPASGASYLWSSGGSPPLSSQSQSVTHKYRTYGTYPYSLTVLNGTGCSYTYNDSMVIPKEVEIFLPSEDTVVCDGTIMKITAAATSGSPPYAYQWNHSSDTSNTISATFNKDTLIKVFVTDASGCTDYDSMIVQVAKPPRPVLPSDTSFCGDSTQNPITLNDRITGSATHVWQKWNDTTWATIYTSTDNSTALLSDSGLYRITVTDSGIGNCIGTAYTHVHINPPLTITSDSIIACAGEKITIRAGDGDSLHTFWTWINANNGTELPYSTRYITVRASNIVYKITAVQKENGTTCTATAYRKITVMPKPSISFNPIPIQCINGNPIDLEPYVSQSGIYHTWTYNGKAVNVINGDTFNPAISGRGKFYLKYTVTGQNGCISTDSTKIVVDALPKIVLPPFYATDTSVTSVILSGLPAGGTWTGFKVAETKPNSRIFDFEPEQAGPGIYNLKYTFRDSTGGKCSSIDSVNMYVFPYPNYKIINDTFTCRDTNCMTLFIDSSKTFSYKSTSICGTINKWLWSFGDGDYATVENPAHIYSESGYYTVSLTISTSAGCTDSAFEIIYAYAPSIAKFLSDSVGCADSTIAFIDSSLNASEYLWSFGDGGKSAAKNPSHIYTSIGYYVVKLVVLNSNHSCTDSFTKTIDVDSACGSSGIRPLYDYSNIRIYPNPVNSALNIDAGANILNSVTVYDAVGREIQTSKGIQTNKTTIPTSTLPAGIYFLRLGIGDGFYMTRFMKE